MPRLPEENVGLDRQSVNVRLPTEPIASTGKWRCHPHFLHQHVPKLRLIAARYPLTVTDGHSRLLLGCQALHSTAVHEAKPVFTRLFKEFVLPKRTPIHCEGSLAKRAHRELSANAEITERT
jgi:hypothetical protein